MSCSRCNQDKPLRWFTGNGPGIPWTQNLVCDSCYLIQLDEHATAWAREITNHFILTNTMPSAKEWKDLVRLKVIELLQRQD